ncbi:hypothetical protein ITP53_46785 [Nonomuraea sp. K274]|uniref:Uncharacterized protein n=1 Tax=Nonomuraea cypriaca TaxID=1187855 RepID=A0A931F6E1_9ACTN|nr:hypothetical protein [Nonomuraea cypriaca]MBF8193056.1 hypothetical protein [Nonomuraea cypriaca]
MASSYTDPGAWRIAMDATEATLSMSTPGGRLTQELPRVSGSFFLRPSGALAGFALRLLLPPHWDGPQVPSWEAADLDVDEQAWLRLGRHEVCRPVFVLCTRVPGEHSYTKIVLETSFSSWSLRLPGAAWHRPRPVTLRLFSEIRSVEDAPGSIHDRPR